MSKIKQDSQVKSIVSVTEENILENYIIITTVNKNYLKIFDLWYHYFQKTNYASILRVITIDKESNDYISKKSIETIYLGKPTSNFNKIVVWRFDIIFNLLKQGKSVIQTDADAIWVDANLEHIINEKFDIQISVEYGIPEDVLAKWKFTLCTGFAIFHSNDSVLSFYKYFLEYCADIKDDQMAFNRLLLKNGMEWELKHITRNSGSLKKFNLLIEAVSYYTIGRTIEEKSDLSVFHPFLPSNNQNLKVLDLIRRLKTINNDPFLDSYRKSIILSTNGWISTAIGWTAVVFHKAIRNLKKKIKSKKR